MNLVVENEDEAKKLMIFKKLDQKQNTLIVQDKTNLFDKENNKTELKIILKSDVQGSSEALRTSIKKINHSEVSQE